MSVNKNKLIKAIERIESLVLCNLISIKKIWIDCIYYLKKYTVNDMIVVSRHLVSLCMHFLVLIEIFIANYKMRFSVIKIDLDDSIVVP